MKRLRAWTFRFFHSFKGKQRDCELAEEIESHLALHIEDNLRSGMSPEEARRNALVKFGGTDKVCEEYRDRRGFRPLVEVPRTFRYAFRSLIGTPVFTIVVVLSLGLGIGANTAIFSAMYQLLLGPLPIENPEELALVATPGAPKSGSISGGRSGDTSYLFSYPAFRELERAQPKDMAEMAGFVSINANVAYGDNTASSAILMISGGYFSVMRIRPLIGRTLIPADDEGDGNPAAVLGYRFWRTRLGGRMDVLNQPIRIAGQAFTIVGVAPEGFNGTTEGMRPDLYIPLAIKTMPSPAVFGVNRHDSYWIYMVARVKPGTTFEQTAASCAGTYAAIVEARIQSGAYMDPQTVERLRNSRLTLVDGSRGKSGIQDKSETPLILMMGCTGMVLLIATANSANLLLARSVARRREIAVRAALGAGRGTITGQFLSQALMLAIAGGIAGMAVSSLTIHFINSQLVQAGAPAEYLTGQLNRPVLLYGLGLSLLTGLLFGLYPALKSAWVMPFEVLNQDSGNATQARGAARVQKTLVCGQAVISVIMLIPTGLFLRSLVNLTHVDLGMRTENLVTFRLSPGSNLYRPEWSRALFERTEEALVAIPGVSGVAASSFPLIGGSYSMNTLTVEGYTGKENTTTMMNKIGPGFFRQMGIPLIMGREFTEHDDLAGPKVAIVNEQFVKTFFPGQNPLGRKFVPGWGPEAVPDIEIVGVVKDSHYASVRREPAKAYYTPWRQDGGIGAMTYYVRSSLPPDQVIAETRRVVRALDANIPPESLRTMDEQVRSDFFVDRLIFQLAGTFALLATALAMLGLYGVMANSVLRRTREIGIRIAVGANPAVIRIMVMREMLLILAIGLILGIPAALALSKLAESLLFGVNAHDPTVAAGASLLLGLAAFTSAYLPARRASRVNPLEALRCE